MTRHTARLEALERAGLLTGLVTQNVDRLHHAAGSERIVELPALDFVYLGIFDYSVALGIPGQVEDPRVTSFIERSARIVRGAGKAIGTTAMNRAQVDRLAAQGVNVLLYGTDTWLVGRGAKEGLDLYAAAGKR